MLRDRLKRGQPATQDAAQLEKQKSKMFLMVFGHALPPMKTAEDEGKYCMYVSQGQAKRGRGAGGVRGSGRGRKSRFGHWR